MRGSSMLISALAGFVCLGSAGIATAQGAPATLQSALRELAPSANLRIIGGVAAAPDAWPWQVYIEIPIVSEGKSGFGQCGGSVIANRWVLTAAHCLVPQPPTTFDRSRDIVLAARISSTRGLTDINPKDARKVEKTFVHEKYNPDTHENDIALLQLRDPITSEPLKMLLIANQSLETPPAVTTITGWGALRQGAKEGADRLMQVDVPLVATDQCRTTYVQKSRDAEEHLAASRIGDGNLCGGREQGGKDACQGDSGGPMVIHTTSGSWLQVGVVSWGKGCGIAGLPGIYTRVSQMARFIRNVMGHDLSLSDDEIAAQQNEKPQPVAHEPEPSAESDNPAGLAVSFDKGDVVQVGDRVAYRVMTRRPGYFAIFDAAPDGKLTQIFPNARSLASSTGSRVEAARVSPDVPRLIPNYRDTSRGFDVRIDEPRGKGLIVAVLSDKPIGNRNVPKTPKTFDTAEEALTTIEQLRSELRRNAPIDQTGQPKPNWSFASHEYTIR